MVPTGSGSIRRCGLVGRSTSLWVMSLKSPKIKVHPSYLSGSPPTPGEWCRCSPDCSLIFAQVSSFSTVISNDLPLSFGKYLFYDPHISPYHMEAVSNPSFTQK
ncbi:hypothetical protein LEMLEM_LOCUS10158 [Lemmus lemmus]